MGGDGKLLCLTPKQMLAKLVWSRIFPITTIPALKPLNVLLFFLINYPLRYVASDIQKCD